MTNRVVSKALIGIEDLLLGTGTAVQARASGDVSMTRIDASGLPYENVESIRTKLGKKIEIWPNVAALVNFDTDEVEEKYVYLLGYNTSGDGGGGLFWLDSTDTTSLENLSTIFLPNPSANGRWKRVDTSSYMSPDRGDANYTIQAFDYGIQLFSTPLSATRTVSLPTSGLYDGKEVSVVRNVGGSYNITIGSVTDLSAPGKVTLKYYGGVWVVISSTSSASSVATEGINGSFEEVDSNNTPLKWAINKLSGASIEIDNDNIYHGINAMKILSAGNGGGIITSDKFPVAKGSTLSVQFAYFSSVVDSLNKVQVLTYDKNGSYLSTFTIYSEGAANPTSFTTYLRLVTVDATAVQAAIAFTGVDAAGTNKAAGVYSVVDNIEILTKSTFDTSYC